MASICHCSSEHNASGICGECFFSFCPLTPKEKLIEQHPYFKHRHPPQLFGHCIYHKIWGRNWWKLYFVVWRHTMVRLWFIILFICSSCIWVKSYQGDQMPLSKWILINSKLRLQPRSVSYLHFPYWPEGHDSTGCIITLHPIWFIASGIFASFNHKFLSNQEQNYCGRTAQCSVT